MKYRLTDDPLEKMLENMRLNISVEYLENYHRPDKTNQT